ncbi:MAG TPA: tRNA (pseudouridine(54)-N(1))-methyltransferase TrmY, partial [Candidatus Methanoperedenaceae archaeon]|nr:tRNA (pseudouridine(54)-N(1))-methyltransferase TrmY [Candidatus Methanoperedenaceae archaeon]
MREFLVVGHKAVTHGNFSLDDMPGSAGRMDILCRCVNAALSLSHDMRRDVRVHLLLLGAPSPPKLVRFEGASLKYLNPDERSAGALIKKALSKEVGEFEIESTPGVFVRRCDFAVVLKELQGRQIIYLREDGTDIRDAVSGMDSPVFALGDHMGMTGEEEALLAGCSAKVVSVGPRALHADQCIVVV